MSTCMKGFGHRRNPLGYSSAPMCCVRVGGRCQLQHPFGLHLSIMAATGILLASGARKSCSAGVSVCSGCHPYGCCNPMQHYRHHSCTCTREKCLHASMVVARVLVTERSCNALLECQEWYTMTGLCIFLLHSGAYCIHWRCLPCRLRLCLAAWLVAAAPKAGHTGRHMAMVSVFCTGTHIVWSAGRQAGTCYGSASCWWFSGQGGGAWETLKVYLEFT